MLRYFNNRLTPKIVIFISNVIGMKKSMAKKERPLQHPRSENHIINDIFILALIPISQNKHPSYLNHSLFCFIFFFIKVKHVWRHFDQSLPAVFGILPDCSELQPTVVFVAPILYCFHFFLGAFPLRKLPKRGLSL